MSDYIFTRESDRAHELAVCLQGIYQQDPPTLKTYTGHWGSLAVSHGPYKGFAPFENDRHVLVVIGGPVLYFCANDFLSKCDSTTGTERIYQRWIVDDKLTPEHDLSGPYTLLLIDKTTGDCTVVTDLIGAIPVYTYGSGSTRALGTHIDALARACDQLQALDQVSMADFVLNEIVTYPYTPYTHIRQETPGSIIHYAADNPAPVRQTYWTPTESNPYRNINEAALALRQAVRTYMQRITDHSNKVAQFLSAGEDSRALAGALTTLVPEHDAYIFLDRMNREGKIASRVAAAYGIKLTVGYRTSDHYLRILPEASTLVGSGHQYIHAHSLHFADKFHFEQYDAVFGGLFGDKFLKGGEVKLRRISRRHPFLPQIEAKGTRVGIKFRRLAAYIDPDILQQVIARQQAHHAFVQSIRTTSAYEWFIGYPCAMDEAQPNLYANRRLFASYEPFLSNDVIKIAAAVPTSWTRNKRLFHRAMKPWLKPAKWILHPSGKLPYFSWWSNMPLQLVLWFYRKYGAKAGLFKRHEGPWNNWKALMDSPDWRAFQNAQLAQSTAIHFFKKDALTPELMASRVFTRPQRHDLLQTLYMTNQISHANDAQPADPAAHDASD